MFFVLMDGEGGRGQCGRWRRLRETENNIGLSRRRRRRRRRESLVMKGTVCGFCSSGAACRKFAQAVAAIWKLDEAYRVLVFRIFVNTE